MNTDVKAVELIPYVDGFQLRLDDGRWLFTPYWWFPRLDRASHEQRCNFAFIGFGTGIHWPDIDEDVSVVGLLRGIMAPGVLPRA